MCRTIALLRYIVFHKYQPYLIANYRRVRMVHIPCRNNYIVQILTCRSCSFNWLNYEKSSEVTKEENISNYKICILSAYEDMYVRVKHGRTYIDIKSY